jgi:glucan phosphoethanolaminetransferase (alkaline phosphatase superfamily)
MHITSQLLYRVDQHPALFAIPNEAVTQETLKKKYQHQVDEALAKQRQWFIALINLADDDWQQLHNHRMISDIQRTAAKELGQKREWIMVIDDEMDMPMGCPFCGTNLLDPTAPICPTCGKVHDPAKLAALEKRLTVTGKA